jgi:hypothetical protein
MVGFAAEVLVAFAALMGVARAVFWWIERRAPRAAKPPPVPTGPPLAGTSVPLPAGTTTFPIRHMTFGLVRVLPANEEMPGVCLGDRALWGSCLEHALALSGEVDHRVRGFAGWIAQDGREEAALAASGFTVETPKQLAAARRAAHVQVADWRLLLQLDTDPAARFEWGDSGRLYLLARDEDVRACRFDRTWLLLQCY